MAAEQEIAAMKQQLAELQKRLEEEEKKAAEARKETMETKDELKKVLEEAKATVPQVVVSHGRRLEVFRERPSKPDGMTVQEWISDVRSQLALHQWAPKKQAAFIQDHLGGNAKKEILGRGSAVADNPEKILAALEKVFGDGDTLPLLQQQFFSYRQKPKEDLIECSLRLVELYDRIIKFDAAYGSCRDSSLKGRLAEAVLDEGLQRELRRLNTESPKLSFFDLRDRAIAWLGTNPGRREVQLNEAKAEDTVQIKILELLERQQEQLKSQQEQIDSLVKSQKRDRRCYTCNKPGHLARDCKTTKTTTPVQSN